mgnify:FL=1
MTNETLTTEQLAERWGISPQTLENWRSSKKGPDYVKMGGVIVYRLEDVRRYEVDNLIKIGGG